MENNIKKLESDIKELKSTIKGLQEEIIKMNNLTRNHSFEIKSIKQSQERGFSLLFLSLPIISRFNLPIINPVEPIDFKL